MEWMAVAMVKLIGNTRSNHEESRSVLFRLKHSGSAVVLRRSSRNVQRKRRRAPLADKRDPHRGLNLVKGNGTGQMWMQPRSWKTHFLGAGGSSAAEES